MLWCRFAGIALALVVVCGCGGGNEFQTAPVSGVVQCEGSPVISGTITFNPISEENATIPGKSATGKVGPDGRFVLTTYKAGDGAIIGMHNVVYLPPSSEDEEEESEDGEARPSTPAPAAPKTPPKGGKPLPCQFGGTATIGVVEGKNDLTINLTSRTPGRGDEEEPEEQGE